MKYWGLTDNVFAVKISSKRGSGPGPAVNIATKSRRDVRNRVAADEHQAQAEGVKAAVDVVGDVGEAGGVTVPHIETVVLVTPVSIAASVAMATDDATPVDMPMSEKLTIENNVENVMATAIIGPPTTARVNLFERTLMQEASSAGQMWPIRTPNNGTLLTNTASVTVPTGTIPKMGLRPTDVRPTWTTTNYSIVQAAGASKMPSDGNDEPH